MKQDNNSGCVELKYELVKGLNLLKADSTQTLRFTLISFKQYSLTKNISFFPLWILKNWRKRWRGLRVQSCNVWLVFMLSFIAILLWPHLIEWFFFKITFNELNFAYWKIRWGKLLFSFSVQDPKKIDYNIGENVEL